MATLSHSLRHVKAHLQELVPDPQVFELCRQLGHSWRNRVLNPALSIQLFLLQLLAKVSMDGLRHVAGLGVSAQAICRAKQRLPLQLLLALVAQSAPEPPGGALWRGLTLYLVDGMSFLTADAPALAKKFGKASNQRGPSKGYPVPKLLALMDFSGGFVRKVIALPAARQEFTCLSRLFKAVAQGGLLLADRGLVSFAHLALLMAAGLQGCFRLPRRQVTFGGGKGSRRLLKRLGKQDLLVRWGPTRCPAWLGRSRWEALAQQALTLRQIAYRVHRKGFRVQWAWLITTLLDPTQYPAQALVELYAKRWQIEVYFRDLKKTLGLELLKARSVEGVRKEILCFVLLYNLVRRVMQQAAARQQVAADRISFVDALRWLLWSSPGDPPPKLKVNPTRKRRSPPRRVKRGRHRFPQMNRPPADLSKPPCEVKL